MAGVREEGKAAPWSVAAQPGLPHTSRRFTVMEVAGEGVSYFHYF